MNVNQNVIIVTHETFYGVPHALRDFLLEEKINELIFIGLPFIEQKKASLSVYKRGKFILGKQITYRISGIASYILDFLLTIYWVIKQKERYDFLIAIDVLNALSALTLKRIGKVRKVIFYAMDFTPIRFQNRLLNFAYHKLEKICVKNFDEIWNVSPRIAKGRERFLHIDAKKHPQNILNSGIWIKKVKRYQFNQVKKHQLLFLGHLLEKQGVQEVCRAIPLVVKKIPDFTFKILGGGEYEDSLKALVRKLDIQSYVEFTGWVKDRKVIDETLGKSAAAIAVYIPDREKINNFSYYGDPIKIKEYLASGLPVILTDVSHNAREIEKRKCGIVVKYDKNEIANAIIFLLNNEQVLKEYRRNALKYAREFDWNVIFHKIFD